MFQPTTSTTKDFKHSAFWQRRCEETLCFLLQRMVFGQRERSFTTQKYFALMQLLSIFLHLYELKVRNDLITCMKSLTESETRKSTPYCPFLCIKVFAWSTPFPKGICSSSSSELVMQLFSKATVKIMSSHHASFRLAIFEFLGQFTN